MDNLQKIVEHIDNVKEKLTDGEYKALMDDLGLLHKKREIYVKFLCIYGKADIVTDDSEKCEFSSFSISGKQKDSSSWNYFKCSDPCDCCDVVDRMNVKVSLSQEILVRKVTDYKKETEDQRETELPQNVYEPLKEKGYFRYGDQMLIYICDM